MAYVFRLPDVGEGLTEGEIVSWLVSVGDRVAMDQPVVEVETDKAVVDIPTPVAGTVLHLGGAEGDTLAVGAVLIVIGEPGESWPEDGGDGSVHPAATATTEPRPEPRPEVAPIVGTLDTEPMTLHRAGGEGTGPDSRAHALPLVRKLARDLGVDLDSVVPSGADGRITRSDVLTAAEQGGSGEPRVRGYRFGTPQPTVHAEMDDDVDTRRPDDHPGVPEPRAAESVSDQERAEDDEPWAGEYRFGTDEPRVGDAPPAGEPERRAMSRMRRTIAENMRRSWAEIPHVTTFDEVDATRLLEVKRALTARYGTTVSIDALVAKAVVPALRRHPDFNARLEGDDLIDNRTIDLGVAVDTPDGLIVVVVRDVASKPLSDLSDEIAALAKAARGRQARPDQLGGQTFTISNIGAVGGGYGTPIVPYGTVGILSVGRAVERPVVRSGAVTVAPVMPLSLSYDHRVVDGGQGRRFLALVIENLAEPALFLAD